MKYLAVLFIALPSILLSMNDKVVTYGTINDDSAQVSDLLRSTTNSPVRFDNIDLPGQPPTQIISLSQPAPQNCLCKKSLCYPIACASLFCISNTACLVIGYFIGQHTNTNAIAKTLHKD